MPFLAACRFRRASNLALNKWPAAKPGSGGGKVQNAKAQSAVKQGYSKTSAGKYPAKPAGMSGDKAKSRKGSPLAAKKK